jgi:hypothetical protein
MQDTIKGQIVSKKYKNCSPPIPKPENYKSFTGIVIDNKSGAPYPGGTGKFKGKYVTGDYDLMDVVKHDDPNCSRLKENAYKDLRHQLNKEMGWPGVQHGPQAYWTSKPEDWKKGAEKFSIPKMMTGYLAKCAGAKKGDPKPEMPFVTVAKDPIRKMPILDTKLTVVAPGRVAKLDDKESVDALICCGCHKEKSRKMDQTLEKKPPIPSGEG